MFKHACPNCEGKISDERLAMGVPCENCLSIDINQLKNLCSKMNPLEFKIKILDILRAQGTLKKYYELVKIEKELAEFEDLFRKGTGSRLWSAQREWARRVLKGVSFAITAPTGIGKTVFGMTMAIYLSTKGKKSYIILPTTVLVKQTLDRIKEFLEKTGIQIKVAGYYAKLSKDEREEFKHMVETGDFNILVTTSQYLALKFDEVSKHKFDFVFVDDVDALLKLSKNIDRVLLLLGFSNEAINLSLRLIKLKKAYVRARANEIDKIEHEIEEITEKINSLKEKTKPGTLIVSTATGKARGDRVKLFRELLNFTIGSASEGYRNVQDLYIPRERNVEEQLHALVKKLGAGGIIFVTLEEGIDFAEKIANFLNERGVKAEAFHAGKKSPEIIDQFSNGEIDILIGVASHYGLLVRGLDLPHRVRYAIFTGVPKFKFSLDVSEETSPTRIYMLLSEISEYLPSEEKEKAENFLRKIRQYLMRLTPTQLQQIRDALTAKTKINNTYLQNILDLYVNVINFVDSMLKRKDILDKIRESPFISLEKIDEELYILIPDVRTYIQASGRTSRLFAGGVAKGISILLVDNEKIFNGLVRQLRWRFEESEWKHLNEVDLTSLLKEVDADRELILKIKRGEITIELKDPVKSALLIVESPSKAFTISTFFGKPARRRLHGLPVYEVVTGDLDLNVAASGGHIFDLVTEEGFHGVMTENGVFIPIYTTIKRCMTCREQFVEDVDRCPRCKSTEIKNSLDNVKALSEIASEVDIILIGTDPDSVTGDSEVLVNLNGKVFLSRIDELFERLKSSKEFYFFTKRNHEYLEPKDNSYLKVLGVDKHFDTRWVNVNYFIRHKVQKEIYEIETATGRSIKVTGDHSLFTLKDFQLQELKISEIKIGDMLVVPRRLVCNENSLEYIDILDFKDLGAKKVDEKHVKIGKSKPIPRYIKLDKIFLEFLGLWIGDGSFHKDRYVRISVIDKESRKVVKEIAKRFGAKIYEEKDNATLTIMSRALYLILKKVFGLKHGAGSKEVPSIIFSLSKEQISAFLRGYISADGTVSKGEPNFSTKSKKLFEQLRTLFLMLGIVVKKYEDNGVLRGFIHAEWISDFINKIGFLQESKNSKITPKKGIRNYIDVFPVEGLKGCIKTNPSYAEAIYRSGIMGRRRLENFLPFIKNETLKETVKSVLNSDIMVEKVVKIRKIEKFNDYVYDFDTETDNFIANNILAHNTEGEKIGWDIATVLSPYAHQIKRVEFHEITKMAIRNALENLKEIDENRVSAQLVRRIEDRWIGFELSRRLWQRFRDYHLSAGRVQTPVLGWIIERYKEFLKSWKYVFWVKLSNQYIVELRDLGGKPYEIAEKLRGSDVKIIFLEETLEDLNPPPPFTTDEMLREASRLLKFGAQETMILAQALFESGLITYHRTDSHRVSNVGIRIAKEYITQEIGEEYFHARKWGTEEEGAHECIRPTRPLNVERLRTLIEEGVIKTAETMTWQHYKLYQLIFNRFIASQMTPAKIKRMKAKIKFNEIVETEIEGITEIVEPGFTTIQPIKTIPKLKEPLSVVDVKFKKIPTISLYTQGDIVELMKKRGIGRPSTYATIIQTLLERGYVEEKNKMLKPTKLGIKVYEYLSKFYSNLVSEERTRELERKMEEIEEGKVNHQQILKDLYQEIKSLK